ncbi:MAG: hypothetical protein JXB03_12195 [Spirochaetales bacterium]|nr:hypothetical protein [Spirochaetales bacterium]
MKQKLIILVVALTTAVSCATREKTGPVDYRLYAGGELTITVARDGKTVMTSTLLPGLEIIGETDRSNPRTFSVTSVNMFGNWPNGWTHCRYEASGTYTFVESGNGLWVNVTAPLELWEIEKGEIRYFDTYFRGDNGLHKARQRVDRMKELARFLKTDRHFPKVSGSMKKKTAYGDGFINVQGAFLFPEYYNRKDVSDIGCLERGETWDSGYTEKEFPEHLHDLRNSGSLWRDFEEAPQMLLSLYNLAFVANEYIEKFQLYRR